MASRTADETAAEARTTGRTSDTDEAAKEGAEGIQDDEHHEEGRARMNRPDEPQDHGAEEPKDRAAGADEAAGRAAEGPGGAGGNGLGAAGKGEQSAGATQATGKDAGEGVDDAAIPDGSADEGDDHQPPADTAEETAEARPDSAVAQGAGAVTAAGLAVVSLTGSWLGTVAGARESLIGQLQTSQGASVAKQIQAVYGDQWHAIALVSGAFALLALIVGVVVLARPAFGKPGAPQAAWIKSVSWAGIVLGIIGLLLAVLKYSDAILGLPSVPS